MPVLHFKGLDLPLEHVACDLCGATESRTLWQRMRHGIHLDTVLCAGCGLCFTNPRPTATATAAFYQKHYLDFHVSGDAFADMTLPRRLGEQRVALLSRVLAPHTPARVFEVGAGAGQFQVAARAKTKWRVAGIEPGERQSRLCRDTLGLEVEQKFIEEMDATQTYDAVVSFHVIEHAPSPVDFLRRMRALVKPGGLAYLEVPNLERPGTALDEFFQLPHFYNFTPLTLRNVMTRAGLRPLHWAENHTAFSVIACADAQPSTHIEHFDQDLLRQRLTLHERLVLLSRTVPALGPLKKVRSTLQST